MAIALPKELIMEQAQKLDLIYWQIFDGPSEIQRQDDKLTIKDSLDMLSSVLESLKNYAKPGDKVKVSMQSIPMTAKGRAAGSKTRTYFYYLFTPGLQVAPTGNYSSGNESLIRKLAEYEEADRYREREDKLLKRIEALEKEQEEPDATTAAIAGISDILNHPLAQMMVSKMFPGQTVAGLPNINGIPKEPGVVHVDFLELIDRITAIDKDFINFFQKFVSMAEADNAKYFNVKNMLMLS